MTTLHPQTSISQFIDDDEAYLKWLVDNPEGYVVNSARFPTAAYLVLHRTKCGTMSSSKRSNWTTTDLIKTCSRDLEALQQWAKTITGGTLNCCGLCKPDGIQGSHSGRETPLIPRPILKPNASPASQPHIGKRANVPTAIKTGCPELDLVWRTFAPDILNRPHVMIPDTEEDLNWHAFLGHSIDMQGFRAAEFAGVDPLSKPAPGFIPLRERKIGVPELGQLWEVPAIQQHLMGKNLGPLKTSLDLLRQAGGKTGQSLAEALEYFPFRKFHKFVRALLQNSHTLKTYEYSFRNWLRAACRELGESHFPPSDFRLLVRPGITLEMALRNKLHTFYQVKDALAPYMLCDWQLWLWNEGLIPVFANFKLDSFHEEFVQRFGRGVVPTSEEGFADWWLNRYPDLPPRLANECIWLGIEHKTV